MSKKRIAASILVIIFGIMLNVGVALYEKPAATKTVKMDVSIASASDQTIELFYNTEAKSIEFSDMHHDSKSYKANSKTALDFEIAANAQNIRLDIDNKKAAIESITLRYGNQTITINGNELTEFTTIHNANVEVKDDALQIECTGEDAYIVLNTAHWKIMNMVERAVNVGTIILKIVLCLLIDVILVITLRKFRQLVKVPVEVIENRKLIFNLAKNDFKTQYAGSYLGIFWAFVQPIVTVLVYWFVFEKGLHAGAMNTKAGITVPFVLWLIAGIVPWFYFQDALLGSTNALMQYSYLVKKVVFKISILPIVKLISALFVHMFFIAFAIILFCAYGHVPDLYLLQILYYTFCMFVLVLGLSYATCAVVGFFRDLNQIISIILQVGVWMTPIMWNFDALNLPSWLAAIFKLNPMYYVVMGYRDAFINKIWFWEHPELTAYFWVLAALVFGIGMTVFKKLKVHFADVL